MGAVNMREDPSSEGRGPERRRRQQTAGRQRAITLGFVVLVIVVVVVLALTVPRTQQTASSTTKSTTTTTGIGETTSTEAGSGTGTGETGSTDASGSTDTSGAGQGENTATTVFTADLTGGNVVPSVETAASGKLTLTVSADGTTVDYKLDVSSIIGLTIARLHQGKVGANGATILTIYNGPIKDGLFTGTAKHGSFTAKDFVGPLKGQTIDDFVGMIESNEIYLAVATQNHHDGELRGQLQ
jgi:hypothetical protein